ncbi:MAG: ATP-binding protein [Lachnospiraceae bacterium]|nr:ATP-binding protein [Lachnospiraceae bacterium]
MIENLDVILSEGESYTVEFKENPDKELPSEVCAFANASGGKVYIGVHDEGYVTGTVLKKARESWLRFSMIGLT